MTSKEIIKRLESDGWFCVGGKGDHQKYKHPSKAGHVVVLTTKRHGNRNLEEHLPSSWLGMEIKCYTPHIFTLETINAPMA